MNRNLLLRIVPAITALAILACALAGCANAPVAADDGATFVIVRHAEKAGDGSQDPPLTAQGAARAQRLADSLRGRPLQAVYATAFARTQRTAAPTADAHGLPVITYDAKQPAADFATRLRREHGAGTVLVVGHSNTVPDIAAALCACSVAAMRDDEYDRRTVIRIDRAGHASFREERY